MLIEQEQEIFFLSESLLEPIDLIQCFRIFSEELPFESANMVLRLAFLRVLNIFMRKVFLFSNLASPESCGKWMQKIKIERTVIWALGYLSHGWVPLLAFKPQEFIWKLVRKTKTSRQGFEVYSQVPTNGLSLLNSTTDMN